MTSDERRAQMLDHAQTLGKLLNREEVLLIQQPRFAHVYEEAIAALKDAIAVLQVGSATDSTQAERARDRAGAKRHPTNPQIRPLSPPEDP